MTREERASLKQETARLISLVCKEIDEQKTVPQSVLNGDAIAAINWKTNREYALKLSARSVCKLSLNKLKDRLDEVICAKKASYNE